jgi:beta-glucanase (GH16 family)
MHNSQRFIVALFPVLVVSCAFAQDLKSAAAESADEYHLVWADEFNVDGPPDAENWSFERGFVRNEELQWYQPENARCEEGLLVIEGRREQVKNPQYNAEARDWRRRREFAEYTSACLLTRRKRQWLYGRFEMRGRIDTRAGLWPAWWTLGSTRGWPAGGEIDIMEYYRGELLANVAWLGRRRGAARWDEARRPIANLGDPDWTSKFHVWRMDWDRNAIELYVDDRLSNETDLATTINGDRESANPFHEPQYMLLNLAIGGRHGGDPSTTKYPARFEVDYVRVYQRTTEKPPAKESILE